MEDNQPSQQENTPHHNVSSPTPLQPRNQGNDKPNTGGKKTKKGHKKSFREVWRTSSRLRQIEFVFAGLAAIGVVGYLIAYVVVSNSKDKPYLLFAGVDKGYIRVYRDKVDAWDIPIVLAYDGTSPLSGVRFVGHDVTGQSGLPSGFDYPADDSGQAFNLGPKSQARLKVTVPIDALVDVQHARQKLFLWGWVSYQPKRLTEFCVEISGVVTDEPTGMPDLTDPANACLWN
jgi:hypothetical protein